MVDYINPYGLEKCMEETIKCAMTCLINTVFCYLFTVKDMALNSLTNRKCLDAEFMLSENLKENHHSLFLQGELLNCQYNQLLLCKEQLGLPFQLTISSKSPDKWKTEYGRISIEYVKRRRLLIYQGMMQQANTSQRNASFIRECNLIMQFCEREFKALYNMSFAQVIAYKPTDSQPPPAQLFQPAPAQSSDLTPSPPASDPPPPPKRPRVDQQENGALDSTGDDWLVSPECEEMINSWLSADLASDY